MQKTIVMKVKYKYILGRKKTAPDCLELEVYVSRQQRVYLTTKYNIPAKYWDSQRQQVSGRFPNAIEINEYLLQCKLRLEKAELQALNKNKPFTTDLIKQVWSGKFVSNEMVISVFNNYLADDFRLGVINEHTYTTSQMSLLAFERFLRLKYNDNDIPISNVDEGVVNDYVLHLSRKLKSSSINTYISVLKKLFGYAKKNKLCEENVFDSYKARKVDKSDKRQALSYEDIAKLEKFAQQDLSENLQIIIDKFLFSCYTGLRISDNNSLCKSELLPHKYVDANGVEKTGYLLRKKTLKTGIIVNIPTWSIFEGKAERIIYKYMKAYPHIEKLFPRCHTLNEKLTTIQEALGISQHLTFHIARHTCATMLADKSGNPFVIKSILGHSTITMSMTYIHDNPNELISNIDKIKW